MTERWTKLMATPASRLFASTLAASHAGRDPMRLRPAVSARVLAPFVVAALALPVVPATPRTTSAQMIAPDP